MNRHMHNSQGEKIAIEQRILDGKPVHCLVIYDDLPPIGTGKPAPMLLDDHTQKWLVERIAELQSQMTADESAK